MPLFGPLPTGALATPQSAFGQVVAVRSLLAEASAPLRTAMAPPPPRPALVSAAPTLPGWATAPSAKRADACAHAQARAPSAFDVIQASQVVRDERRNFSVLALRLKAAHAEELSAAHGAAAGHAAARRAAEAAAEALRVELEAARLSAAALEPELAAARERATAAERHAAALSTECGELRRRAADAEARYATGNNMVQEFLREADWLCDAELQARAQSAGTDGGRGSSAPPPVRPQPTAQATPAPPAHRTGAAGAEEAEGASEDEDESEGDGEGEGEGQGQGQGEGEVAEDGDADADEGPAAHSVPTAAAATTRSGRHLLVASPPSGGVPAVLERARGGARRARDELRGPGPDDPRAEGALGALSGAVCRASAGTSAAETLSSARAGRTRAGAGAAVDDEQKRQGTPSRGSRRTSSPRRQSPTTSASRPSREQPARRARAPPQIGAEAPRAAAATASARRTGRVRAAARASASDARSRAPSSEDLTASSERKRARRKRDVD
ncbi:hypothetical protein KFE25_002727 [Diacronema lutheri]|uniref:Uncharacterized protein n=1 Tax=Diacronema lutheri TaxID=2081491 RepID=A0A8J5XND8_DIALT|nr:hypothetical protein KFE25_002727 [Diacronema lutheri]